MTTALEKGLSMLSESRNDVERVRVILVLTLVKADAERTDGLELVYGCQAAMRNNGVKLDPKILSSIIRFANTEERYNLLKNTSFVDCFPKGLFKRLYLEMFAKYRQNKDQCFVLADILRSFLASYPSDVGAYRNFLHHFLYHRKESVRALAVEPLALQRSISEKELSIISKGAKNGDGMMKTNCLTALRILGERRKLLSRATRRILEKYQCRGMEEEKC